MVAEESTGRVEPFGVGELFFSTTDDRGFIRSSNDVFVRVSRYEVGELEGQPHNVVRHPDMPRVVFRELWDHLKAGQGIGAYVLNRAKDGSPYWVFAVARPIGDGHLSVRLKPTTELFDVVADLYRDLRAAEAAVEADGGRRSDAMEASAALLGERLRAAGFPDYDTFMRVATVAEVMARRAALAAEADPDATPADDAAGTDHGLARFLDQQLGSVEAYLTLNRQLTARSASLVRLTSEASLLGFNVKVAASRLGADGGPLRALAGLMQESGIELVERARSLASCLDTTRSTLEQVGFSIAVASLQNDMSAALVGSEAHGDLRARENIALMSGCLRADLTTVFDSLAAIGTNLTAADDLARDLERSLRMLDAVIGNGQVEVTRTSGASFFVALFERAEALVTSGLDDARQITRAVTNLIRVQPTVDSSMVLRTLEPEPGFDAEPIAV